MDDRLLEALDEIRATALAYPETYEESPWGDRVVKVNKKIFLFAGTHKGRLNITTKLPETAEQALEMPFAKPTAYGMGKSGWVSSHFVDGDQVPVPLLLEWLDESYRTIAPKKLVKALPEFGPPEEAEEEAPIPAPTQGPVLFIGYDPFRSARGVTGLARAVTSSAEPMEPGEAALAAAAEIRPVAIVVDVCRNASEGIDFAGYQGGQLDVDALLEGAGGGAREFDAGGHVGLGREADRQRGGGGRVRREREDRGAGGALGLKLPLAQGRDRDRPRDVADRPAVAVHLPVGDLHRLVVGVGDGEGHGHRAAVPPLVGGGGVDLERRGLVVHRVVVVADAAVVVVGVVVVVAAVVVVDEWRRRRAGREEQADQEQEHAHRRSPSTSVGASDGGRERDVVAVCSSGLRGRGRRCVYVARARARRRRATRIWGASAATGRTRSSATAAPSRRSCTCARASSTRSGA
ncbi:MAG: MmcQ/YjbR family DNA-binding protein [Proteobacteria bacterium]|nr:MmcQ/YjbR family DNA-binding protein [Pseudomonadota bacterium]